MNKPQAPQAILADDNPDFRKALKQIVKECCIVLAEAENGRQAIDLTRKLQPEVLLLDISMPLLDGFAVARELSQDSGRVKIVFVTAHTQPEYIRESLKLGVPGYVHKSHADRDLCPAVREVLEGRQFCSPGSSAG